MQELLLFSSAVMIGVTGSTHCLGMCGGIASAQSFSQSADDTKSDSNHKNADNSVFPDSSYSQPARQSITTSTAAASAIVGAPLGRAALLPRLLTFNAGRLVSYTMIGFIAGVLGAMLALNMHMLMLLRSVAAVMLILMGLYVGQWWTGLSKVEVIGSSLWSRLSPVANSLRQKSGLQETFLLGMLWGWLPCGLVYSALTWSMSSADPKLAAILMFGFGLGTLPSMLAAGLFAYQLRRIFSMLSVRRVFAVFLIVFGIWSLPVHWSQWLGVSHHSAHSQWLEKAPDTIADEYMSLLNKTGNGNLT